MNAPYYAMDKLHSEQDRCGVCYKAKPHLEIVDLVPFYPIEQNERQSKTLICQDCLPEIKLYFEKVKDCFESVNYLWPLCAKRWVENDERIHFNDIDWDVTLPLTIVQLMRDARYCFLFGLFAASIVSISSAVELAINIDNRLSGKSVFKNNNWGTLGKNLYIIAQSKGINVQDLLEDDEIFDKSKNILFICRRNRHAHGDVREWSYDKNPFIKSGFMETEAVKQVELGQNFIMSWAKSIGNPAVYSPDGNLSRKAQITANSSVLNIKIYNPFSI